MRQTLAICVAVLAAVSVQACGEKPQVVVYEQGHYQGKADTQPWDNDQFKGDRAGWENAIKTRNQNQNEYRRF